MSKKAIVIGVVIGVVLPILIFWGSAVLELLLHAVELILETLELITERVLEFLLVLSPYQAQAATAWIGFALLMAILFFGYRKLKSWWERTRPKFLSWRDEEIARFAPLRPLLGWPLGVAVLAVLILLIVF